MILSKAPSSRASRWGRLDCTHAHRYVLKSLRSIGGSGGSEVVEVGEVIVFHSARLTAEIVRNIFGKMRKE